MGNGPVLVCWNWSTRNLLLEERAERLSYRMIESQIRFIGLRSWAEWGRSGAGSEKPGLLEKPGYIGKAAGGRLSVESVEAG
jgi:hypothetical protein